MIKINQYFSLLTMALALNCKVGFTETQSMIYKNHKGSILEFKILSNNIITGTFKTEVSSPECIKARSQKKAFHGVFLGNVLAFTVAYPECGSLLAVTGNFYRNGRFLDTVGIINKQSVDIKHAHPGVRLQEHDTFKKI